MDNLGEPSRPRSRASTSPHHSDDDEDFGFGLSDLIPEPESPLPAPYSFATYDIPDDIHLELGSGRKNIITRLVGSHPLWAHHLWNTSRVLSTYLLRNPSLIRSKNILELGAGAGLPSLVSALGGAKRVVVTDYPDQDLIRNIAYNLDINLESANRSVAVEAGHVWGADVTSLRRLLIQESSEPVEASTTSGPGYDLLLLSDLVFNHSQHNALISTVNSLNSRVPPHAVTDSDPYPTPCILVFTTHHRPHLAEADLAFFPLLAKSDSGWAYEQVIEEYAGAMFPDDPGEERIRGTVKGWRCWRIREGEQAGERLSRVVEGTI